MSTTVRAWAGWTLVTLALSAAILGCEEGPAKPGATTHPAAAVEARPAPVKPMPATLPASALVGLDKLTPAIAKPADAADADKLSERSAELVRQAEEFIQKGEHGKAIPLLDRARGFDPKSPRILRDLGLAYVALGDNGKGEEALKLSADAAPDHVNVQLLLANLALGARQFDQALLRFRTALACSDAKGANPDTAEALLGLATLLEVQGYWAASLECHRRLAEMTLANAREYSQRPLLRHLVDKPEDDMIDQGRLLMRLNKPGEAAVVLERAYRRHKAHPTAGQTAVEAYLADGNYDQAQRMILEMLREPATSPKAIDLAVQLCRARHDATLPEKLLTAYNDKGGSDWQMVVAMAQTAAELGPPDQAEKMLAKFLSSAPEDSQAALPLTRLYVKMGKPAAAADAVARLLRGTDVAATDVLDELRPLVGRGNSKELADAVVESATKAGSARTSGSLLTVAGVLAQMGGDVPRAIALYRQAIKADANFWHSYEALGSALAATGEVKAVEELNTQIASAASDSYVRYYLIGKNLLEIGQVGEAAATLEQARLRRTAHVPTLLLLARTYAQSSPANSERLLLSAMGLAPDNLQVVRDIFELYMKLNRQGEAGRIITRYIQSNPQSVPGKLMLARYYTRTSQADEARKLLATMLAEAPNDLEVRMFELSMDLPDSLKATVPAEKAKSALSKIDGILKIDPKNVAARQLQAAILANQGQHAQAAKAWQALHGQLPANAGVVAAYISQMIKANQQDLATAQIEKIAQNADLSLRMRQVLIGGLVEMKKYDLAEKILDRWTAGPEADKSELRRLALSALVEMKKHDKALTLADLWLAKTTDPKELDMLRRLAIAACEGAKQYDKMLKLVDAAIAAGPEENLLKSLQVARLACFAQQGRFKEMTDYAAQIFPDETDSAQAICVGLLVEYKKYDEALRLVQAWLDELAKKPKDELDQANLARARRYQIAVLMQLERKDDALKYARQYVKDNETPEYLRLLSTVLGQMERDDEYVAVLEKLYKLDPEQGGINNDLSYSYAERGINLAKAEAMARKALAERPDEVAFLDTLGWVLYKQGRFDKAAEVFAEALSANEDEQHAVILDHAGDTYWRCGRKQEAIDTWERAIEFAKQAQPQDRETRRVLELTPAKVTAGKASKLPALAPLGQATTAPSQPAAK